MKTVPHYNQNAAHLPELLSSALPGPQEPQTVPEPSSRLAQVPQALPEPLSRLAQEPQALPEPLSRLAQEPQPVPEPSSQGAFPMPKLQEPQVMPKPLSSALPELLSPAGSRAGLFAALGAGADAVYLGAGSFNARRNASNFLVSDLRGVCDTAHLAGAQVYLTLNTLVLPPEFDEALELARQAWYAGVDALIVADLGLMATLHAQQPQIPLHASTQAGAHSVAACAYLAELGSERITLARELPLSEITRAAAQYPVEVFAHGALCFSYSGSCLMSSLVGCRSANRGLCAQPCRLPYELIDSSTGRNVARQGNFPLSTRDLCTLEELPALIEAGVASLKIEGRMRKADYVAQTTAAYRAALYAYGEGEVAAANASFSSSASSSASALNASDNPAPTSAELGTQRGFTAGYLHGNSGDELMDYQRHLNLAQPGADTEPLLDEGRLFAGNSGLVFLEVRVRAKAAEPLLLDARVLGHSIAPLSSPAKTHADAGHVRLQGPVLEPARGRALTPELLREHLGRVGGTPFSIVRWDIELDEGLGSSFGELHKLKDQLLEELTVQLLEPWHRRTVPPTVREATQGRHAPMRPRLAALVPSLEAAKAAIKAGATQIYYQTLVLEADSSTLPPSAAGRLKAPAWAALPLIERSAESEEGDASFSTGTGVVVNNLGQLQRVRAHHPNAPFVIGPGIAATNAATLALFARQGATRVWLGPELSREHLDTLGKSSPVPLSLTVSGAQEVMTSEHCVFMVEGPCNGACGSCKRRRAPRALADRKGYRFPVRTDGFGRSHVYNAVSLDLLGELPELLIAGIDEFVCDCTLLNLAATQAEVERAARALKLAVAGTGRLPKREGRTTGHYHRGVQ